MGKALPVHLEIMLALEQRERARAAKAAAPAPVIYGDEWDSPDMDINNWQ